MVVCGLRVWVWGTHACMRPGQPTTLQQATGASAGGRRPLPSPNTTTPRLTHRAPGMPAVAPLLAALQPPALHPEDARHHRHQPPHRLPAPAQRRAAGRDPALPGPQPPHPHRHAGGLGCCGRWLVGGAMLLERHAGGAMEPVLQCVAACHGLPPLLAMLASLCLPPCLPAWPVRSAVGLSACRSCWSIPSCAPPTRRQLRRPRQPSAGAVPWS